MVPDNLQCAGRKGERDGAAVEVNQTITSRHHFHGGSAGFDIVQHILRVGRDSVGGINRQVIGIWIPAQQRDLAFAEIVGIVLNVGCRYPKQLLLVGEGVLQSLFLNIACGDFRQSVLPWRNGTGRIAGAFCANRGICLAAEAGYLLVGGDCHAETAGHAVGDRGSQCHIFR